MKRLIMVILVGMFFVSTFTSKASRDYSLPNKSIIGPTQTFEDLDDAYKFEHDGHTYYQRQGIHNFEQENEIYQQEHAGQIESDYRYDGDEDDSKGTAIFLGVALPLVV